VFAVGWQKGVGKKKKNTGGIPQDGNNQASRHPSATHTHALPRAMMALRVGPAAGGGRRRARTNKRRTKKKDPKILSKNFPFLESFSYQ